MANEQFIIPGTLANKEIRSIDVPDREIASKQLVGQAFGAILTDQPNLEQLETRVKSISPEISRGVYSDLLDIQVALEHNRVFIDTKTIEATLERL